MRLIGIVGHKNAGKTTLTERLVAEFVRRGLVVSTLKRTHHALDLDTPGTDSHRHRVAGARQVVLDSDARITTFEEAGPRDLASLLTRLAPCDIALAEGWKRGDHFRIEVWRPETGLPPLAAGDPTIAAVATPGPCDAAAPHLALDDVAAIADFALEHAP
ncbi:molybdopterin-guanine dinucleotide biosynthesis protein B [uncultured Jannaschia sp.]|uniref:molybdopterin-guanine dinucleotide biosynthesis protein B n=1 Tax=uncultured Jannaschia sp. TaxID=293347 RepID=UPI002634718A|nr:molybdopterin-guanine dinucleotide biosynthesis protein B [uncultured Jannaschia sp.]